MILVRRIESLQRKVITVGILAFSVSWIAIGTNAFLSRSISQRVGLLTPQATAKPWIDSLMAKLDRNYNATADLRETATVKLDSLLKYNHGP